MRTNVVWITYGIYTKSFMLYFQIYNLNRDCILLVVEVLVILSRLTVIQTYVNYLRKVPVHVLNNSFFILGLPYAC